MPAKKYGGKNAQSHLGLACVALPALNPGHSLAQSTGFLSYDIQGAEATDTSYERHFCNEQSKIQQIKAYQQLQLC